MSRATKIPGNINSLIPGIGDTALLEKQADKLKVMLLNDDYTPMEFMVMVTQEYFNKDHDSGSFGWQRRLPERGSMRVA